MRWRVSISQCIPPMALMVFTFYSLNTDSILGLKRYNPYVYQDLLFMGIATMYLWRRARLGVTSIRRVFTHPVMVWLFLYLGVSVASLAVVGHADFAWQGILYAVSTTVMVGAMVIAFMCPEPPSKWDYGHWVLCVLIVVCVSLFFDPILDFRAKLGAAEPWQYDRTRAGGIFLQPNGAGNVMPFLLAAVMTRVRPSLAIGSTVLALCAVALTFSRSGILMALLVVGMGFLCGYLPRMWTLVALFFFGLVFVIFDGSTMAQDLFHIDEGSGLARLTQLGDFVSRDAVSSDVRVGIASEAWKDVCHSPITGGGVGYSWYWADTQPDQSGTHNMYLRHMLEYGLAGGLLWPLLMLALYRTRNRALDPTWVVGILVVAFIAGLFCHNLTEQGSFLVVLMGAVSLPVPIQRGRHAARVEQRYSEDGVPAGAEVDRS